MMEFSDSLYMLKYIVVLRHPHDPEYAIKALE